jgi:polyisoprenoid-binding protein YceI
MSSPTAVGTALSTWKIDPSHTAVEFAVKHMMISTVRGRFGDYDAAVTIDESNPAGAEVVATISAGSINTGDPNRDAHLKSADFFDAEGYPKLTFVSKRVEGNLEGKFKVIGDLTIRGTTREIALDVEYQGEGRDPYGNEKRAYTATTKVDRRDFGLMWNVALEAGGLLVSNDIRITIEAQFKRES